MPELPEIFKSPPSRRFLPFTPFTSLKSLDVSPSQPFTVVKGSEAGFPLFFKPVKPVKGSEGVDPLLMINTAAKRPQSRSDATSFCLCPRRKFCVSI